MAEVYVIMDTNTQTTINTSSWNTLGWTGTAAGGGGVNTQGGGGGAGGYGGGNIDVSAEASILITIGLKGRGESHGGTPKIDVSDGGYTRILGVSSTNTLLNLEGGLQGVSTTVGGAGGFGSGTGSPLGVQQGGYGAPYPINDQVSVTPSGDMVWSGGGGYSQGTPYNSIYSGGNGQDPGGCAALGAGGCGGCTNGNGGDGGNGKMVIWKIN